jgi:hypothetical protein
LGAELFVGGTWFSGLVLIGHILYVRLSDAFIPLSKKRMYVFHHINKYGSWQTDKHPMIKIITSIKAGYVRLTEICK